MKAGHNWLVDDFDYRCNDDSNPELMKNVDFVDGLNPLLRDLLEGSDFFVILGDKYDENVIAEHTDEQGLTDMPPDELKALALLHNVPIRVIRRRNPEFQEQILTEDMDQDEIDRRAQSEDALDHVDSSLDVERIPQAPADKYDLVIDETTDYSSNWFPYPRDKSLKGYARNLAKAITRGSMKKRSLFLAIQDGQKRGILSRQYVSRLWELYAMQQFVKSPDIQVKVY